MLSLSFMDGYRTGTFSWKGKTAPIPNLLKPEKDLLYCGDITIERPTLYEKDVEADLRTASLLKIPYSIPKETAVIFNKANIEFLSEKKDACPIYVSKHMALTQRFLSHLLFHPLFFIFCPEERRLLSTISCIRKKFPQSLIFTKASPEEIPLLLYAGVDLFPFAQENGHALHKFLSTPTKEYLEKECNSTVRTKRLLKLLYREFYTDVEQYTSYKKKRELYISNDSLYRPEVERFRQRVRERYTPFSNVFVLFPCSARKPYSLSHSHRLFRTAVPPNAAVTELILTSPLGVVPRELEDYVDYDIPVTGHWSCEEVEAAASVLVSLLEKVKSPLVYAHLPREYLRICKELPCEVIPTVTDNPLSQSSLERLSSHLCNVRRAPFLERKMRAVSQFLFNEDIFPENVRVHKRGRHLSVEGDAVFATYSRDLYLTGAGASLLANYTVTIDFPLKGDVFCPGVIAADPQIRPGEPVVIKRENAVGIGRAVLPGSLMTEMKKGVAVKVKKRFTNAGESQR